MIEAQQITNERLNDLIDVLKNQRVTREIIREIVEQKPTEVSSQAIVPFGTDGTHGEIEHVKRLKSAADTVREFLENNPHAMGWTVRDIEQATGVGKSTVQRVLAKMKKEQSK